MPVISTKEKYKLLKQNIINTGKIAIAFSGGVDSTFLAGTAFDAIGEKAVAITVVSEAYPPVSILETRELAESIGIRLIELPAKICDIHGFRANTPDRCYYCKKALFSMMLKRAKEDGIDVIADGSNADDTNDFRPGMRALEELGIKSPLRDIGFTKAEIRSLSRELNLPTWNKQSFACLASRIPYGSEITPERLEKIWKAEALLHEMGISRYRVRDHGSVARLELDTDGMSVVMNEENRIRVVEYIKSCGFTYVTLDLQGFRTGSMNEVLPSDS